MKKRILSLLVALLMVVQLFSITALATDRTEEELTAEVIAGETVDHTIPAATEETAATSAEADAPAIPDAGDKPEVPETSEDSEIPEEPVAESKWQKGAESHWVNPMFKNSPALSNNDLSNAGDPIDRDLTMSDFTIHEKDIVAELSTAMVERKELVYLYYETYNMLTEEDLEDLLYKATVPSPYNPSISNRSYGDYLMFSILEYAYTVEYIEMNGNYYNLILFGVSYLTTAEQEQELSNRVVQIESEIYKDGITRNSLEQLQFKAIYDYICANVKPATELSTEDLTPYTAYGALINGKALSQGYVMLFYYLCRTFELNNRIIYGTADGYDHVWNIVRIHNKWYNTDIFCDAVIGGYDYFLKGSTDFPDQHIPAPLYNTETFNQDYPIAEATYNPEHAFYGSVDGISWSYNVLTKTLTFTGSGPMPDDQCPWRNFGYSNGTSVIIEEGITHIGTEAFDGFSALTTISLPASLQSIGTRAFCSIQNMQTIALPENLVSIGSQAFGHTSLKQIFIPASVTEISPNAFTFSQISHLEVDPNSNSYSTDGCFLYNKDKTSLILAVPVAPESYSIAETVIAIESNAFYFNTWLTSLQLPEGITSIGNEAFNYSALTNIELPSTLTTIGDSAFRGASQLRNVTFSEGLQVIGNNAFYECKVVNIILPKTVTTIGDYAFRSCLMASAAIPTSVTSIGNGAFKDCLLTDIYYPGSAEQWASISIGNDNEVLNTANHNYGQWAISQRSNAIPQASIDFKLDLLTNKMVLTLPSLYYYQHSSAYANSNIGNAEAYPWHPYRDKIQSIVIEKYVTHNTTSYSIDQFAFANCINLTEVTFPEEITNPYQTGFSIGYYAFANCTALKDIILPKNTTSISSYAFANSSIASISLPNEISYIENNAFEGCSNLSTAYYQGTEKEWERVEIGTNSELLNSILVFVEPTPPVEPTPTPTPTPEPIDNPFVDVAEKDYFFEPVLWAVQKGITGGISATQFAPNNACTRGQVVTFLWRAAGSPEPQSTSHPFTDISANQYYYKAVLWAVENGITSGLNATTFGPNNACTRGQIATFLWRANGSPEPQSSNNPFSDVNAGPFYKAILWAVEEGITTGYAGGTFRPGNVCTRGNIVTFLYRAYN